VGFWALEIDRLVLARLCDSCVFWCHFLYI